ncbi:glycosyl transferase [Ponticoccus sp. SC2-23]|uniref:glycosyl transferase n=1 Tax=Alexandriicola marinus TaxID=2081710 RepID=UPI000FDBD724|nr:glycosyl transferase [Alexandriicola marinus]MBM1222475.1 glycosyl transferase [Ponticoccus sp. SC6-9]MBM1226981.1 glycosyl transferase [Ponticoccus sp. SC6-15]MBM1231402.1 glycosyl transferase [Ponticoccus sp. SC6-38]MBM1235975.1 glycosyl transferase [Ponticoccus sp. SC6-45]MBM1240425.1 glycosyl transferase [Ponticoccus sp. SC6-49]MBM1244960.1 glycosyl transferase [Ponticoccus sp. SC2-64]MBM1249449.1 glycosyl transferase [Ponticoccus sp. SC6-42]MBM1253918.1 glycosyl transferase [Pontico
MNPTAFQTAPAGAAQLVLQRIVLPDFAVTTETGLFVHLQDAAHLAEEHRAIAFAEGGMAWFTTYGNLFNLRLWGQAAMLDGLWLRLAGEGRVGLKIWHVTGVDFTEHTLFEDVIDLSADGVAVDLSAALDQPRLGVLYFRLQAMAPAVLREGAWLTTAPDLAGADPLRLAISITTFRREEDVAATAARITGFLDGEGAPYLAALGGEAHLFVVDNGQSVDLPAHPRLTLIPNANLGGAGGFARGLAAAEDGGFTHCLFMDDDASFMMESLVRTLAFLRLARSPKAAVSGAMISEARRWAMWERGAVFNGACRPEHVGVDLRDPVAVTLMELAAAAPRPEGFYAGWWYFAFPVAEVRHYPFPFFVRGDDISFSLANDFDTVTLSGVVSFQEDFSVKESPLTLYLDLRNHLHHHMVQDGLRRGALGTARMVVRFLARSVIRMHYDSAEAQLMAWDDVMKGPDFFAENVDMAQVRPLVTALARTEAWQDADPREPTDLPDISADDVPSLRQAKLLKWTLNGHLVPFWKVLARHRTVPMPQRGLIWPLWGLSQARFVDPARQKTYVVRHSKARFAQIMIRAAGLLFRWIRVYPTLAKSYRDAYPEMAARAFWEERFLDGTAREAPAAE